MFPSQKSFPFSLFPENRKVLPIQSPIRLSKEEFLENHKENAQHAIDNGKRHIVTTSIDPVVDSSRFPDYALKRITLSELRPDTVHHGRVLVCRTIVKPFKFNAVMVLVEDPIVDVGWGARQSTQSAVTVDRIALYNFVDCNKFSPDMSKDIPVGTRLLIRDPFYKSHARDGISLIRCNNPDDVRLVPKHIIEHPLLVNLRWADTLPVTYGCTTRPVPESFAKIVHNLKQKGNEECKLKNFASAVDFYTRALKLEPNNLPILCNRARAHIQLMHFQKALQDTAAACEIDAGCRIAVFFQAKALYGLRQYEKAFEILKKLVRTLAMEESGYMDWLVRARERVVEQQTGRYNIMEVIREAWEKSPSLLNRADYVGPVKIVEISGKGRGMVTTQKVAEGTLLICCKAYAIVFESDKVSLGMHELLISRVAEKLKQEPLTAAALYNLYAGSDMAAMSENETVHDNTMRIANIVKANTFQIPEDLWASSYNCEASSGAENQFKASGLWILPSLINHACFANTVQIIIGDFMFIRATLDIAEGEEITLPYIPVDTYDKRKNSLQSRGFECRCSLCQYELDHSKATRDRTELLEKFETLRSSISQIDPAAICPLTAIISELRKTYLPTSDAIVPSQTLQIGLFGPLSALASLHTNLGQPEEALKSLFEMFEILPRCGQMVFSRMETAMMIARIHNRLGDFNERKKWLNISKNECKMIYGNAEGGGEMGWEVIYSEDIAEMPSQ